MFHFRPIPEKFKIFAEIKDGDRFRDTVKICNQCRYNYCTSILMPQIEPISIFGHNNVSRIE